MISYITGTILQINKSTITILTSGGLGYDVVLTPSRVAELRCDQDIILHTFMRVTDSAHTLFGFFSTEEKAFFKLLLTVSGVGPKSAMNIFALGSIEDIEGAIGRKDVKYLTAVQGMGKKTAERLVVELQNKVHAVAKSADEEVVGTVLAEVVEALVAMGYLRSEVIVAVKQVEVGDRDTGVVLKECLKLLS